MVFQRLPEHLERGLVELGKFVGEEHAVVRKGYLSGLWIDSASHKRHLGDGVVGSAERTLRDERSAPAELSRDAVYLRGLKTLAEREGREDGRQTLCHHGLAAARRPYHYHVVSSCGCHLERALHVLLSTDVGEVELKLVLLLVELAARVDDSGLGTFLSGEEGYDVAYVLHAVYLEIVHHGCLAHVLLGNDQSLELLGTGAYGDGKHSLGRLETAVETQLAYHHIAVEPVGNDASRRCQDGYGERQVETAAFLAKVGRSHVDGDVGTRKLVSVILKGGRYAVPSFAYGSVTETGEVIHHPTVEIHLDGNSRDIKSVHGCTICFYEHQYMVYCVFPGVSCFFSSSMLRLRATTRPFFTTMLSGM